MRPEVHLGVFRLYRVGAEMALEWRQSSVELAIGLYGAVLTPLCLFSSESKFKRAVISP